MSAVADPSELGVTLTVPGSECPLRRTGDVILGGYPARAVGRVRDGVWDLLGDGAGDRMQQWSRAYAAVRNAEGRCAATPEYYRRLPHEDLSGSFPDQWKVRARSFVALSSGLLRPPDPGERPLRILDAGAGNGWMAARLAGMGHRTVALDVNIDPGDGLAAHENHPESFVAVRAPMDLVPLPAAAVDVVVFGASLHYVYRMGEPGGGGVLAEARRVVRPGGHIVVVDSPLFDDARSGARMVVEQHQALRARLGVEPPDVMGDGFLHRPSLLADLHALTGGTIEVTENPLGSGPRPSVRSLVRRLARFGGPTGSRETARFATIVATVGSSRETRVRSGTTTPPGGIR